MSASPQLGSIAIGASESDVAEFWASFMNCDRGFDIPLQDQGPMPFQSVPPQIQVNGLSLLLDIGVACTSPHHTGMHSLFSIYHHGGLLFGSYEYFGTDHAEDMAKMAADTATQQWWALMVPMQRQIEHTPDGAWWMPMEEISHFDGQK